MLPFVLLAIAFVTAPAGAAPLDAVLARGLARAGGASGGIVLDLTTGRTLAARRADTPRSPASVEKLYTTSTALLRFGANATLQTTVLGAGTLDDAGTWHGDLYLRGGGDPTFGTTAFTRRAYGLGTTVTDLATRLRAAGIVRVSGGVYGDESWLDRLRGGPDTGFGLDVADIGGPLSGLLFDRGLAREDGSALQAKPATFAAAQLVAELRRANVHVRRVVGERPTPVGAQELASVASPTMATLIRLTMVPSDNLFAEMLLKDVGARFGAAGSTSAGIAVVKQTLARYGLRPAIADGSGLSRNDRTTPRQVVALLRALRADATFRAALPVAGRSGTLALRMRRTVAQDRCQAKTGTLSNVSALAGYCATPNGHLLAFATIENHVLPLRAKAAEDRFVVALARARPSDIAPTVPVTTTTPPSGGATPAGVR